MLRPSSTNALTMPSPSSFTFPTTLTRIRNMQHDSRTTVKPRATTTAHAQTAPPLANSCPSPAPQRLPPTKH